MKIILRNLYENRSQIFIGRIIIQQLKQVSFLN